MLGGGTFVTQNKVLPGSYINFVSKDLGVNVFGDRGVGAIASTAEWGPTEVQVVTKEDFQKNSLAIFGYDYMADEIYWVRDFFKHAKTMLFYRLNGGSNSSATSASNKYASAKYPGTVGNNLKIVIQNNADDETKFDVLTYFRDVLVDSQVVSGAGELKNNDYVNFIKNSTLEATAGMNFTGGKSRSITGSDVQKFLNDIESYSFNAVAILAGAGSYQSLLVEWTKRMRDEVGKKFQAVVALETAEDYDYRSNYEGVVLQYSYDLNDSAYSAAWLCGALAGCEINESLTNTKYDGEAVMGYINLTQMQLEELTNEGVLCLHNVNDETRVLLDINSLTEFTTEKGKVFQNNQTIRVCDQIAMDIAEIFNNYYLGKVPNDESGRISLWQEIVKHHRQLSDLRAIEGFDSEDVVVSQGDTKTSVVVSDAIKVINAMEKLYMTVYVE